MNIRTLSLVLLGLVFPALVSAFEASVTAAQDSGKNVQAMKAEDCHPDSLRVNHATRAQKLRDNQNPRGDGKMFLYGPRDLPPVMVKRREE